MIKKYHVSANKFDVNGTYSRKSDAITITDNSLVDVNQSSGAADRIYYDKIYSAGTYAISLKTNNTLARFFSPMQFTGGTYNSYYGGYYKDFESNNVLVLTFETDFTMGFIFIGSGQGVMSEIMLNTGSTALPYEPYGNTWNSIPYRKYGTETDTLTSLPADVIADGQSASAVIKGALNQSGTPTPANPIYPTETGDKTANLFDITTTEKGRIDNGNVGYASSTTALTVSDNEIAFTISDTYKGVCCGFIEIPNNATHLSFSGTFNGSLGIGKKYVFYDSAKTWLNADMIVSTTQSSSTVEIPTNAKYVRMSFTGQVANNNYRIINFALNLGSTALPYQPYGYKIPILSGGTTTNIYLGDVQSTRRIKKYEFTGNESWTKVGNVTAFYTSIDEAIDKGIAYVISSHYEPSMSGSNGTIRIANSKIELLIYDNYSSADDFKTYLQQQYANGTPVTVWYVLATETTGIVNEPIRKIGNYADSVSVSNIPTTGTAESFDIDTSLKPSEVSLTYHGWHEHSDTKF